MKIKRILFYVISVLVCFLLQTSVFNFLKLAGVMPNILLILTVTIAFIRGRKAGIVIGFVCGLLIDIFSGNVLGQNAFVYLMFGYVNGWFHTYFYEDDILLPIGLLTANSLAYSFVIFFFFFAMRGRLQFFSYLFKVMIPEAVYTGIVALLIYKILLEVDIRIRDGEKGVCSSVTKNLRESRKITGKQTACLDHTDRCALLCVDRACVCPSDRRRSVT